MSHKYICHYLPAVDSHKWADQTACGLTHVLGASNHIAVHTHITCPKCKETELYKQDLIFFEVGCDGDWDKYFEALDSKV